MGSIMMTQHLTADYKLTHMKKDNGWLNVNRRKCVGNRCG